MDKSNNTRKTAKPSALGKGFGSLLGVDEVTDLSTAVTIEDNSAMVIELDINNVVANP